MIAFNNVVALFSLMSGMANVLVGYASETYSGQDLMLASLQIVLAIALLITGLCKIKLIIKNTYLASLYI